MFAQVRRRSHKKTGEPLQQIQSEFKSQQETQEPQDNKNGSCTDSQPSAIAGLRKLKLGGK
jgi:hypothetical protein